MQDSKRDTDVKNTLLTKVSIVKGMVSPVVMYRCESWTIKKAVCPNASGGLTPVSPSSELQEVPVAIREQSGVLCFHSR